MPPTQILISAGEASGDMYAARLAAALRARADVQLFGMGGPRMRDAGVELVADCSEVSLVGIVEIAKKYPALKRVWKCLLDEAARRKPRLAILTDLPGFHLRLARALKRQGVQNVYFVCPQFWAWRPWRANLVRRRFAQALCIFPFKEKFYRDAGVAVKFIGHPLVGNVRATMSREEFCQEYDLAFDNPIITILPGSRRGEIAHHAPILAEGLALLKTTLPAVQAVIAVAPGINRTELEEVFTPNASV